MNRMRLAAITLAVAIGVAAVSGHGGPAPNGIAPTEPVASVGRIGGVGDVDGDGRMDLIARENPDPGLPWPFYEPRCPMEPEGGISRCLAIIMSQADDSLRRILVPEVVDMLVAAVADLSGDGKADVVGFTEATPILLVQVPGGDFAAPARFPSLPAGAKAVAARDFTGDGRPDLLTLTQNDGVYLMPGQAGTLGAARMVLPGSVDTDDFHPRAIPVGDADGDGDLDAWIMSNAGVVYWLRNNGGRLAPVRLTTSRPVVDLTVLDANGDGATDLVTIQGTRGDPDEEPNRLVIQTSTPGSGVLTAERQLLPPIEPGVTFELVRAGNVDDLRGSDLVVTTERAGQSVRPIILAGNGDGTFADWVYVTPVHADAGAEPVRESAEVKDFWLADLTGDGVDELVFTNDWTAGTSIWRSKVGRARPNLKLDGRSISILQGETASIPVTVENEAVAEAPNVRVSGRVPDGLRLASGPCGGGSVVSCQIGWMDKKSSRTVTVNVRGESPGEHTLTLTGDPGEADSKPANNTTTWSINVRARPPEFAVQVALPAIARAQWGPVPLGVTLGNQGGLAQDVRLEVALPNGLRIRRAAAGCSTRPGVFCQIGSLSSGDRKTLEFQLVPVRAGTFQMIFTVRHRDGSQWASTAKLIRVPSLVLTGTSRGERLRGSPGNDTILGQGGNDQLYGGAGNDTMNAGPGRDTISGEDGSDVIAADDRQTDRILCGRGYDRVQADRIDSVAQDCERVSRR